MLIYSLDAGTCDSARKIFRKYRWRPLSSTVCMDWVAKRIPEILKSETRISKFQTISNREIHPSDFRTIAPKSSSIPELHSQVRYAGDPGGHCSPANEASKRFPS